jgi:fumarylpyruvate hydrolase
MSEYLFEIARPSVSVAGTDKLFPVHRIYCVGKNYAAHTKEMGGSPERDPPVFFMKAADSVVPSGATVRYPPGTSDLHYEIELVIAIGKGGEDIDEAAAAEHIFGYAVGIDLTRRDLQGLAKGKGGPWDTAKNFEGAAPITEIHTADEIGHPEAGRIWLAVNGDLSQEGDISDLIWNVPETIAGLSNLFTLAPGDLIFTGTPAGVGAVERGDHITGGVDGVGEISIRIE